MHPYICDCYDRKYARTIMFLIAIIAAYFLNGCTESLALKGIIIPWYIGLPGITAVFGLIYGFYNRFAWKRLSFIPNLNGTWFGRLRSSFDGNVYDCYIFIHQKWDSIIIEFRTSSSSSHSDVAAILLCSGKNPELRYEYNNNPKKAVAHSLGRHEGTACLEINSSLDGMEGSYYTCRKPHCTYGDISLKKISRTRVDFQSAGSAYARISEGR